MGRILQAAPRVPRAGTPAEQGDAAHKGPVAASGSQSRPVGTTRETRESHDEVSSLCFVDVGFFNKNTLIYQEEGEHKMFAAYLMQGCIFHLMMQVPGTSKELAAIAPGTSAACTAAKSSALRPNTGTKAKVSKPGCQRSMYDPPVNPAVEPISFADYPKRKRDAAKRRLQVEDAENVSSKQFEKGELVFTLQEEGVDRHGYLLPLSVAVVDKVSPCGWKADVTYLWATTWDGVFRKAQFKDEKGKNKNWREKGMSKKGVVLMRGSRTKSNTLNAKTKEYLVEVLGEDKFREHAKPKEVSGKAAAVHQPPKKKPTAQAAKKGPDTSPQARRVTPAASCLRPGRVRAKRLYSSEEEESDKSDGSASDSSAASVETCTSTESEELLNVKIPSRKTNTRASVAEIERDRRVGRK